jgi:hypothetical protein
MCNGVYIIYCIANCLCLTLLLDSVESSSCIITMFIIFISIISIITVSGKYVNSSQDNLERAIENFADNFDEDPFIDVVDVDRVDGES